MTEKEVVSNEPRPKSPKRRSHPFLILLIGIVLGAGLARFIPRYAGSYLRSLVSTTTTLEGEVTDKHMESTRLVLKVSTAEGVLLASFMEMQKDVDLLVEKGDSITLEADRYRPFLEEPTVLSVQKSGRGAPTEEAGESSVKQAYQKKMEAQLDAWEEQLMKLEAKAIELGEDVKKEYEQQLDELRQQHDVARQKLDELKRSSAAGREDLKLGVELAWSELKEALDKAASRFEDPSSAS